MIYYEEPCILGYCQVEDCSDCDELDAYSQDDQSESHSDSNDSYTDEEIDSEEESEYTFSTELMEISDE